MAFQVSGVVTIRLLIVLVISKITVGEKCESGQFTESGECCILCHPGTGLMAPCGQSNTVCEPCVYGKTFSDESSLHATCKPCSTCPENSVVMANCTFKMNTVCECQEGYYSHTEDGITKCVHCLICPMGHQVSKMCNKDENTKCEICPPGFYSEKASRSSSCQPCNVCDERTEVMIMNCTRASDTVCMDKNSSILLRSKEGGSKQNPKMAMQDESDSSISPTSLEFIPQDESGSIIPVYCSLLAAVVVGLLAYVAFKCWNTCKQKRQLAKARAGELGTSPEGEKLHSDSGVFLDTHSLQEQQNKIPKMEQLLYINLPPHKQEELEQMLGSASGGRDWRRLASLLGYDQERIDTFGRGEDPVHTLLFDWSTQDGASLQGLCNALAKIERSDIVEHLRGEVDSSSVV